MLRNKILLSNIRIFIENKQYIWAIEIIKCKYFWIFHVMGRSVFCICAICANHHQYKRLKFFALFILAKISIIFYRWQFQHAARVQNTDVAIRVIFILKRILNANHFRKQPSCFVYQISLSGFHRTYSSFKISRIFSSKFKAFNAYFCENDAILIYMPLESPSLNKK